MQTQTKFTQGLNLLASIIYSNILASIFGHANWTYDDALTEQVNHYANRTLIVSCTKDYT